MAGSARSSPTTRKSSSRRWGPGVAGRVVPVVLADRVPAVLLRVMQAAGRVDAQNAQAAAADAIILDSAHPEADDHSLLRRWRQDGLTTPVLLLTDSSSLDKANGGDVGADDYLAKPFELEELLSRLRALTHPR